MALTYNSQYPYVVYFENQPCSAVYWNGNKVFPDPNINFFWIKTDTADSLKFDYIIDTAQITVNKTIRYSFDGETWTQYNNPISLSAGQKIYLMSNSTNPFYIEDTYAEYRNSTKAFTMVNDSTVTIGGNIMALYNNSATMPDDAFHLFFCALKVRDASKLLLPSTTSSSCYMYMFSGCAELTNPPLLPAMTVKGYSYRGMFNGCTSLTTSPSLPATTISGGCYEDMFMGCTSLTTSPSLPATTLGGSSCYRDMFYGCTSLTTVPLLPATTLTNYCYYGMFCGCTSLKFSTTQTVECPNPYRIPTSGTGTSATHSLTDMFKNTGGTYTGSSPGVNTTYYTNATIIS